MKRLLVMYVLGLGIMLYGHGTEVHSEKNIEEQPKVISEVAKDVVELETIDVKKMTYEAINKDYLKNIKPIFQSKCFDCHSNRTKYPWYYELPIIKSMIDGDIKEAKTHIDMSNDFPFLSHETPMNDLKSIKKSIQEGHMPPLRYILAHWDARLNDREIESIVSWSEKSIEQLLKSNRIED